MLKEQQGNRYWLSLMMILIVSGSHIGMIWLNAIYSLTGRGESIVTIESILGIITLALFSFFTITRWNSLTLNFSRPIFWLLLFALSSSLREIQRIDSIAQVNNINIFIAIFANTVIGFILSREIVLRELRIPYIRSLLIIYLVWYAALVFFFINGDLGFYDKFSAGGGIKERLSFVSGYSATEIPVYIGFHLPVLLYVLFLPSSSRIVKFGSLLLVSCSLFLSYLSLSSAVFFALILVFIVFYATVYGLNHGQVLFLALIVIICMTIIFSANKDIVDTTLIKFDDAQSGEGRGLLYGLLIETILNNPNGIGLAQFSLYYKNNLEQLGTAGSYPHHNFLGIGAELGFVPLLFYVLFVFSSAATLIKLAFKKDSNNLPIELRLVASVGLAVFIFQQFRGFFHDTWTFKELYFWLGIGLGVATGKKFDNRNKKIGDNNEQL